MERQVGLYMRRDERVSLINLWTEDSAWYPQKRFTAVSACFSLWGWSSTCALYVCMCSLRVLARVSIWPIYWFNCRFQWSVRFPGWGQGEQRRTERGLRGLQLVRGWDLGPGWTANRKCIPPSWSWTENGKEDRALSERALRQWAGSGSKAAL